MKKVLAVMTLCLAGIVMAGCPGSNPLNPPNQAQLAPGYRNAADQQLGQDLAAVSAFKDSEVGNYNCDASAQAAKTCLSPAQKAVEKPYLNSLIDAVNVANAAYTAYHQGSQTLAQAQTAYKSAQSAQTTLTTNKGVK